MTRATWAILSAGVIVGFSGSARAEEKPDAPCPETHESAPAVDLDSEARAFERDMDRYERLRGLTLRLADEAKRATERDFERAVELYLAKVALTKSLAARDASAPSW
jgi:hypothetical protein